MREMAVPSLPMTNPGETRAFYEKLGFVCAHEQPPPDTFLIMMRGTIQLHFFEYPINQHANFSGCVVMTPDLDALHAEFSRTGVAKIMPIEDKPWGAREFAFFDPSRNSIRFQHMTFEI
jgi:catechol 2,3-dioxygenase-like lactoylglutathione lyase family enzyme